MAGIGHLQRTSRLCTKKEKDGNEQIVVLLFLGNKKKVSISYFSICCVRNLRPPFLFFIYFDENTILLLSIVIPAFNEASTIHLILTKIKQTQLIGGLGKEILIVDDCSIDQTQQAVARYQQENTNLTIRYFRNEVNRGKGFSLARGIREAVGDFVIVQDADLEYDPEEYNTLLKPMLYNNADVVYGSRFMGGNPHRILFFWHSIGNLFLTFLSNVATNLNLTDMETGYKLFKREIIQQISLKENRFGFEPEVTAKVARIKGIRIYEVGISYYGRTYEEGKKINWKDGLRAIYCIIKYNYFSKN